MIFLMELPFPIGRTTMSQYVLQSPFRATRSNTTSILQTLPDETYSDTVAASAGRKPRTPSLTLIQFSLTELWNLR